MGLRRQVSAILGAAFLLLAASPVAVSAQPPGVQTRGTVTSFDEGVVTLADGSMFPVTEQTRVSQLLPRTINDLVPGQYVAISASRRAGGVLQASVVSAFPEGTANTTGNQREMLEIRHCEPLCSPGDLMTNATIADATLVGMEGAEMTVTFAGETATVSMTADTRFEVQRPGSIEDIQPGIELIGFINPQGTASIVWVFGA